MGVRKNQFASDGTTLLSLLYLLTFVVVIYVFFSTMKRIERLLEEIRKKLDSVGSK